MRVLIIAIAALSTSIQASTTFGANLDCSAVWHDDRHKQSNTSGAIRLTVLHHRHPCSPVRHLTETDPSLCWQRSRTPQRERQFAAGLFLRRRRHALPTNISAPVTSAGAWYGFVAQVSLVAVLCGLASGNATGPGLCAVQENTCIYYMRYMDKSVSIGRMGTDTLSVGEEDAFSGFVFGCSSYYAGVFGRYSGILGFASGKASFFSQVVERTRSYKAFSFYLPSPTSVGYIQVGAYDGGGLAFTPMFTNGSDYYIVLTGITVDALSLDLIGDGSSPGKMLMDCYVDLGTPRSVLPGHAYEKLNNAVAERIRGYDRIRSSPGCFEPAYLSTERVIPEVQLQFSNGVRLVLDEQKLMFKYGDGVICVGFMQGTYYLLGSMQMQMTYAAQDVEKSRMGFSNN